MIEIKFKKLHEDAKEPKKAHDSDAGFDLWANSVGQGNGAIVYGTGLSVEIPKGLTGFIFPRSSVYKTGMRLANSVGVIDSGYRGEIKLIYYDSKTPYELGDRVGQLVVIPTPEIKLIEADQLSESDRGQGGFGSSGK